MPGNANGKKQIMDLVHDRSVGIDISKRDAKVCVRVPGTRAGTFTNTVTTRGATTSDVLRLCEYLEKEHVTVVTMESTSDYWKPFYYLMEDSLPVMLVNAKHARNIPGRKSDVSDCQWLAQLGLTVSFGRRSCRPNRSGNCEI
jgi:transposase